MPGGTEQGSPSPGFTNGYILGFAGVLCVISSLALAGTHGALKERQLLNAERAFRVNVLGALALPEGGGVLEGEAIDRTWEERVGIAIITPEGAIAEGKTLEDVAEARDQAGMTGAPSLLAVYYRKDGEQIGAYALPLYGRGLWGPISGFIAIGPDAAAVQGTVFFAPGETPGLGKEIEEDWFEDQWVGKSIVSPQGETQPIRVVKGRAADLCKQDLEYCVDGVSGATITARGVSEMVEVGLTLYDPYLDKLRTGGAQ